MFQQRIQAEKKIKIKGEAFNFQVLYKAYPTLEILFTYGTVYMDTVSFVTALLLMQ